MLSDPAYAYGVNLQPAGCVAEEVMQLSAQLAQEVRETGVEFTLGDLDQRFQDLLKQLEDSGVCRRGEDLPPIVTKEQWLQAQWNGTPSRSRHGAMNYSSVLSHMVSGRGPRHVAGPGGRLRAAEGEADGPFGNAMRE
jgi:hypothetical protein